MPAGPRIALATAAAARGLDPDEPLLLAALAAHGADAEMAVWDDPAVAWDQFDLVVLRSTWDYPERLERFRAWLTAVDGVTTLRNPAAMVAWNLDKHYLAELAAAGVPVVPTLFVEPGGALTPPAAGEYVVKPAIGAGSRDAARYRAGTGDDEVAAAHVERLLAAGRSVLVQPYLGAVDHEGELALVHLGGEFSHAARKRVRLPGAEGVIDGLFAEERTAAAVADDEPRSVAAAALAAVPPALGEPLYARVDLVRDADGRACVLELELAEPSLFLPEHRPAADRAAAAILAAAR